MQELKSADGLQVAAHRAGAGPFTLTPTYKTAAFNLAKNVAGARLARLLNEELK
jgi:hypothetical protein